MNSKLYFLFVAISLTACSCNDEPITPDTPDDEQTLATTIPDIPVITTVSEISLSTSENAICESINKFGIDFYQRAADDEEFVSHNPNYAVSPLSLAFGLALFSNIINPVSAEKIATELGFKSVDEWNAVSHKLMTYLPDESNQTGMELANSVWYADGIAPCDNFKRIITDNYFGTLSKLNFADQSSVDVINGWVNKATHEMIPSIIDGISSNIEIFFANALYFKANWKDPFAKNYTDKATFYFDKNEADVEMMHGGQTFATYYKTDDFETVTFPYEGNTEMIAILPAESSSVDEIVFKIDNQMLNKIITKSTQERLVLSLPKFESKADILCSEIFDRMNINIESCNIGGFNPEFADKTLPSSMIHKTILKTTESGTEAAAATAGWLGSDGEEYTPITVTFNRPFIYIIRNTITGSIILMGQFTDPSK